MATTQGVARSENGCIWTWSEGLGEGVIRDLDLDIHEVPDGIKGQPAHLHFDVRYAFQATTRQVRAASDARAVGWFPMASLDGPRTDASVRRAVRRLVARRGH